MISLSRFEKFLIAFFAFAIAFCLWQVVFVSAEPDTTGGRTMTNPWNMDAFDLYGGDYLQFDEIYARILDVTGTAKADIFTATTGTFGAANASTLNVTTSSWEKEATIPTLNAGNATVTGTLTVPTSITATSSAQNQYVTGTAAISSAIATSASAETVYATKSIVVKGAGTTTGVNFQTQNSSGTPLVTGLDNGNFTIDNTLNLGVSASTNGVINVPESLYVNIDSNASQTDRVFSIAKDRTAATGGTALFRVQEDGNVGINTTSPSSNLEIKPSNGGNALRIDAGTGNNNAGYLNWSIGGVEQSAIRGFYDTTQNLAFYTGNTVTEKMRINNAGNVIIGSTTATPAGLLTINGGSGWATGGWSSPSVSSMKVNIDQVTAETEDTLIQALRDTKTYLFNWKPEPAPVLSQISDVTTIQESTKVIAGTKTVDIIELVEIPESEAITRITLPNPVIYDPTSKTYTSDALYRFKDELNPGVVKKDGKYFKEKITGTKIVNVTDVVPVTREVVIKKKEDVFKERYAAWQKKANNLKRHKVAGIMLDEQKDNPLLSLFAAYDDEGRLVGKNDSEAIGALLTIVKKQQEMIDALERRVFALESR